MNWHAAFTEASVLARRGWGRCLPISLGGRTFGAGDEAEGEAGDEAEGESGGEAEGEDLGGGLAVYERPLVGGVGPGCCGGGGGKKMGGGGGGRVKKRETNNRKRV